jgi:hypothetical protein
MAMYVFLAFWVLNYLLTCSLAREPWPAYLQTSTQLYLQPSVVIFSLSSREDSFQHLPTISVLVFLFFPSLRFTFKYFLYYPSLLHLITCPIHYNLLSLTSVTISIQCLYNSRNSWLLLILHISCSTAGPYILKIFLSHVFNLFVSRSGYHQQKMLLPLKLRKGYPCAGH